MWNWRLNVIGTKIQHAIPATLTTHQSRNLACKLESIDLLIFFWNKIVKFNLHKAMYELLILTMFMWLHFSELHC